MNDKHNKPIKRYSVFSFDVFKWAKTRITAARRQQILLISLVIFSISIYVLTNLLNSNIKHKLSSSYGVIVDCGSTGSRAHIFRWTKSESTTISHIELVRNDTTSEPLTKHITPGVSSFKDNPNEASDYMEPIMEFISDSIPIERHVDTPVYFLGTAGLRLLDESTQQKIMTDLTNDLGVKYNFPKIKSRVISGEYEGIYSWLSLNMASASGLPSSYGMIELGGASTQVTFELSPEIEESILQNLSADARAAFVDVQLKVSLGSEETVKLFAATFLGLGVYSARESAIDLLVLDNLKLISDKIISEMPYNELGNYKFRLEDPCLNTGSSETILRPVAFLIAYNKNQARIGLAIKENEDTFEIHLKGSGKFDECSNLFDRVLRLAREERLNCPLDSDSPCPMDLLGSDFIPYLNLPFIGLSEMYFTTDKMMNLAGQFNRTRVLEEARRICESDHNQLVEIYASNGSVMEDKDRILHGCSKASWLLAILHNYGFRMPEVYENFNTLDRLNGVEVDWTIGAMLTEVALN